MQEEEKRAGKSNIIALMLAILLVITIAGEMILFVLGGAGQTSSGIKSVGSVVLTAEVPKETGEPLSEIRVAASGVRPETEQENTEQAAQTAEHRYEVVGMCMSWTDAKAYCEEQGGHLATIESQEEYNKILGLAAASGRKVLWLGAMRGADGVFRWIDGKELSYTSWLAGEPNNEGGTENCLVMFLVNNQWSWADVPSDVSAYYSTSNIGFVCEYDK